jgi:hypothetical protein
MTISHAGYTFGGISTHGTPIVEPWRFDDGKETYFGVIGSQEVWDQPHDRAIRLEVDFLGYTTKPLLETDMRTLDEKINDLSGTLTIDSVPFRNCVFKGFERFSGSQYVDGTDPGWMISGVLVWRQLAP